jgi:hypothetical protein
LGLVSQRESDAQFKELIGGQLAYQGSLPTDHFLAQMTGHRNALRLRLNTYD